MPLNVTFRTGASTKARFVTAEPVVGLHEQAQHDLEDDHRQERERDPEQGRVRIAADGREQRRSGRRGAAIVTPPREQRQDSEFVASDGASRGSAAAKFTFASCRPSVERLAASQAIAVRNATCPRPSGPSARAITSTLPSDRKAAASCVA